MFAQNVEVAYRQAFDEVKVIFMHREFVSWAESIATQRAVSKKKWYKFYLRDLDDRYSRYVSRISGRQGLHIDFEDVFIPDTRKLIMKLSEFLDEQDYGSTAATAQFDLFGQIIPFNKAFFPRR